MKKFLSLVLALIMTMSLVTVSAGAKDFTDDEKINYEEAVAVMSEVKVLDGYADGSFNPQGELTRGAAAKIICNLILGPTTAAELHADTAPYKDVPVDHTFAGYIAYCAKEGIISGYADGTFRPAAPLTGYAFMKMLLGALGYDQEVEGYTGANWSINVAKRALAIGLNKGLVDDFSGIKSVTREEAALYAFNTLQATMVEYDQKTVVTVAGAEVALSGNLKEVYWGTASRNDGNIKKDGYVQFAEKYFSKLSKKAATDDFGRPAYTWVNNKKDIGTFVDYTTLVAEYTDKVKGGNIYDALSSGAVKDCTLTVWVDGVKDPAGYNVVKNNMVKGNKTTMDDTGKGVLTQLFYDADAETITVVEKNTYLAKASGNYNATSDNVNLTVYKFNTATNAKDSSKHGLNIPVKAEDVAAAADVKKGDFVLVTIANGAVMSIEPAETETNVSMNRFVKDESITSIDGTKYEFADALDYDHTILNNWDIKNMANTTYNVYLDTYGYVVGIEEYATDKTYAFVTGFDLQGSNIASTYAKASVIFPDGTMKTITVDVEETNKNLAVDWNAYSERADVNKWYSYTVDKNDIYTLDDTANQVHYDNNIVKSSKVGMNDTATNSKYVYGNLTTNYIFAKTGTRNGMNAITGVDSVIAGMRNVDIDVVTSTEVPGSYTYGCYALYDGSYIVAAVIIGENNSLTTNYAYVVEGTPNDESIRTDSEGYWYWTYDAITKDGYEPITVKAKYNQMTSVINGAGLYELKLDADGNVVVGTGKVTVDGSKHISVPDAITAGTTKTMQYSTVYALESDGETLNAVLNGSYMRGIALAAEYEAYVVQDVNGVEVTSYGNDMVAAVASLYKNDGTATKNVYALFNNYGEAELVVIVDPATYGSNPTGNYGTSGQLTLNSLSAPSAGNLSLRYTSNVAISSGVATVTITNASGVKVVNQEVISGVSATANVATALTIPYAGTVGGSANYIVDVTIVDGSNTYYITGAEVGMI